MLFLGTVLCLVVSGCAIANWIGVQLYYKNADLPENQVLRDIPYWNTVDSHPARHRLDLFLPQGTQWPVLVFVHGGGWTDGDKSFRVGRADIYGNIGRFYASRGVGVAVINYGLLPDVPWRHQPQDVARATAWVHAHIAEYGGHASRLFLAGHSAGAQLVTRVALDPELLKATGLSPGIVCGVISVSGAALDLTDEKTYELGESLSYYEKRFRDVNGGDQWKQAASPVYFVGATAPPFLILYAKGEKPSLQRQMQRLQETLANAGIQNRVVAVPGESHELIVLTLSRPDKISSAAILDFIHTARCP